MAETEKDVSKQRLFHSLATVADAQARVWEEKMLSLRQTVPVFRPRLRGRTVARLVRIFGVKSLRPVLAAMKIRGLSVYQGRVIPLRHPMPSAVEEVGDRHKGLAGGNLRASVFGVNDGLVSNTSLIMGVAGAGSDVKLVITSGVAGLLAGALSMAAGEYVSMRSQREMYETQIDLERAELAVYPDQEAEELALIYAARGMDLDDARRVTKKMMQDPEHALNLLSREELGLNPDDLGSPWGAAFFSFFAFTLGAVMPLIPFFFEISAARGVQVSAVFAGAGLFLVGGVLSLFTGKNAVYGAVRMLLIGGGAGVITYSIGRLLGVELG